ncbi:MAG: DUF494 domain-containing protein [Candidatus Hydrogenedens sp.]|jgi:uncharacterized protein Smg (DUF494 family)|nr:DUF494 domain-containing protein [Candidatus Hydrogenedens sp.]
MKTAVQNLVYMILLRMAASNGSLSLGDGLRLELEEAGYNGSDIEIAFEYVSGRIKDQQSYDPAFPSRRHLNYFESLKINPDVLETLIKLEQMGLIEPIEREVLLEGFQHAEGQADLDDLDYALSVMIGPKRNNEAQNALMTVSDGYIPTYH